MKRYLILLLCLGLSSPLFAGIEDGLVAHYPFNGSAADVTGTNNGLLFGNATFTGAVNDEALTLSTEGDYVQIPASTNINLNVDSKTISIWFNIAAMQHHQVEILDKTAISDYDLDLLTNANPVLAQLRFRAFDTNGSHSISALVPLKQWINAVVIKNGASISLYTNSVLVGTNTVGAVTTKNNALFVGAGGSPYQSGFGFTGLIGDLRIYNRAVSLTEIQELYFPSWSALSISPNISAQGFQIRWNAISGKTYQLQYATELGSTNWNILYAVIATNSLVTFSDTNTPPAPQRFYRAVLLP